MMVAKRELTQTFPLVLFVLALSGSRPGVAAEQSPWRVLDLGVEQTSVVIRTTGSQSIDHQAPVFVVTHGMGGTCDTDRFHQLVEAISVARPDSLVLLIDWSQASQSKLCGFSNLCRFSKFRDFDVPNPFQVAGRIDGVANEAAEQLRCLEIDPLRLTLIGESFGNWVNAGIAAQLGGVDRILAMNPATAIGGYDPPDLSQHARISLAFHTYSYLDTLKRVSHYSILMETPEGSYGHQWHTMGISNLTRWIDSGNTNWICGNMQLKRGKRECFDAISTLDGRALETKRPMRLPPPTDLVFDGSDKTATESPPPAPSSEEAMQNGTVPAC